MANSILTVMTEQYDSMTRSDKKLANYILDNSHDVQYLSINSLAKNSGVSEATITRFCHKLKLASYYDLKIALAKSERTANSYDFADSFVSFEAVLDTDTPDVVCKKLCDSYAAAFEQTREQLSNETIRKATEILSAAEHVYCFGQGGSMVIAMEAWARFSTVSQNFVHIADSHMQMMATALATPRDAILFFSYSGATIELQDVLHLATERNVPLILVTHFCNSSTARLADLTLYCGYNESPLQGGSVAAKMGQLLLIDCLFHDYCNRNAKVYNTARLNTIEALSGKLL